VEVIGRIAGERDGSGARVSIGSSSLEAIHVFALAQVQRSGLGVGVVDV
jgi:hypothetical protein